MEQSYSIVRDSLGSLPQIDLLHQQHKVIEHQLDTLSRMPDDDYFVGIPLERNEEMVSCVIYTFVFMLFFALLRFRGKNLLQKLLQTVWQRKNAEVLLSDGIVNNSYYYLLALSLSFSIPSLAFSYYQYGGFQMNVVLILFIFFIGYHLWILFVIKVLGWCFNRKNIAQELIAHVWAMNIIGGMLFAPLVIAMVFMKTFAIETILSILFYGSCIYLLYRFIRWNVILFANRVSILYMILYLCALEIVPLMIFYKLITD